MHSKPHRLLERKCTKMEMQAVMQPDPQRGDMEGLGDDRHTSVEVGPIGPDVHVRVRRIPIAGGLDMRTSTTLTWSYGNIKIPAAACQGDFTRAFISRRPQCSPVLPLWAVETKWPKI